jgi:dihydrofolate reductase
MFGPAPGARISLVAGGTAGTGSYQRRNTMSSTGRTVVGNIALSLDGRVNGPGGDYDMGWIAPHAVSDTARDHMVRVTGAATTALLGRKNFEGFGGFWPAVADDEAADPRDRTFSRWLNGVEKVVLSHSPKPTEWANTRIVDEDAADVVRELRQQDGGDIIVLASGSVLRALLEADELDRLSITLCPQVAGGGTRLFEDGIPASSWTLRDMATSADGAICLLYDRVRD